MRSGVALGVLTALMGLGCAAVETRTQGAERDFSGLTRRANPSLLAGPAHVVEARVRPGLPLQTSHASRVDLDGGRFVVCWTRGGVEEGRRALAQAFKGDGSPLGAPIVISPPGVDVVEMPRAVATDGNHVVATFAAASDRSVDILAVLIETKSAAGPSDESTARR